MANLKIGENDRLNIGPGDHFSVGSLDNEGQVDGEGTLGLDWSEPIQGTAEDVTCPVIEENVPEVGVTGELTARSLKISCDDIGAETYYAALDGRPKEVLPADRTRLYGNLEPHSTHYVNVSAENSRGSVISAFYTYTLPSLSATLYRVVQDIYAQQEHGTRGQNCAFMARILDTVNGVWLTADQLESITMNIYRLVRNVRGIGRKAVEGMTGVPVGLDAVSDEIQQNGFWTRDSGGYNFFHVPNQRERYMFPEAGAYQVEYEMIFKTGNPLKLVYELYVL